MQQLRVDDIVIVWPQGPKVPFSARVQGFRDMDGEEWAIVIDRAGTQWQISPMVVTMADERIHDALVHGTQGCC
jgi:hypothetical protein